MANENTWTWFQGLALWVLMANSLAVAFFTKEEKSKNSPLLAKS
jgi:hypothetical protein